MSEYRYGLLPFDPEKHARFNNAQWYGFTFDTPTYPIDKTGGITDWGMGGNGPDPTLTLNGGNPVGDCGVCMAPMHADMMAAVLTGGDLAANTMTSDEVVNLYFTYTGGQDTGVDLGDWLLWLTTHDLNGNHVPVGEGVVEAFVKIELAHLDSALEKFDIVGVGVDLNPKADEQFPDGWDVGPGDEPDPSRGHAILYAAAMSADGPFGWISWGARAASTKAWKEACPQQAFAILTKVEAEAKNWTAMYQSILADLRALGATVYPPPVTPPPAPPAPKPTPLPPAPPNPTPEVVAWLRDFADWVESFI